MTEDAINSREWALRAAALALMLPILLPCLVSISPVVYFDVDPRSATGQAPITAIGPSGAAWLHVLSVAIAGIAVGVSTWAGGRVRWGACALFAIGAGAAAYHLGGTFDDRVQCSAWVAAAAVALAAAHLAQHEPARRWMVAAAVAMLLPLLLQAAWYVLVEHPATVEMYLRDEVQMLRARGWLEGSPQHELYRRRLTDASALGAFGLSNVFGSAAAALTLMAAALGVGLAWGGRTMRLKSYSLVAAGLALAGVVTLALTHSKGAVLAAAAGGALLAMVIFGRNWSTLRSWLPVAAMALVVMAAGAVLVRASLGPPDNWQGERSLLFRLHYWQGAGRAMVAEAPGSLVVGVGPTGFNDAYLQYKNPINPEEVTSTHNVFVDLLVMLGVGGAAWSLMLMAWLWQGGRSVALAPWNEERSESPAAPDRPDVVAAVALGSVLFGIQYAVQIEQLMIETALLWMVSAAAFIAVAAALQQWLRAAPAWTLAAAFVAGAALLIHNQIEMAFFHLPSTATVWGLVGLAAGTVSGSASETNHLRTDRRDPPRSLRFIPPSALIAIALALAVFNAAPIQSQQSHVAAAAEALQKNRPLDAARELDAAAAVLPADQRTLRWRVQLRLDFVYHAAGVGRSDVAGRVLDEARHIIEAAQAAGLSGPGPYRLLAAVEQAAVDALHQPQRQRPAADALRQAIALSPYSIPDHLRLADLLWQMNQRDEAVRLYQRTLKLSEWNYLDPAKQLTPAQREHITQRLEPQMNADERR